MKVSGPILAFILALGTSGTLMTPVSAASSVYHERLMMKHHEKMMYHKGLMEHHRGMMNRAQHRHVG